MRVSINLAILGFVCCSYANATDITQNDDYKILTNANVDLSSIFKDAKQASKEEVEKFDTTVHHIYRGAFAKFQAINALFDNFYGTDLANVEKDKIAETVKEVIRNRINGVMNRSGYTGSGQTSGFSSIKKRFLFKKSTIENKNFPSGIPPMIPMMGTPKKVEVVG